MNILETMQTWRVRLTFQEEVLGSLPGNPELQREYIVAKALAAAEQGDIHALTAIEGIEEEVRAVSMDEEVEKSRTIFPKSEDGKPFLWDYQVRGFLKEGMRCVKKYWPQSECAKVKANRQAIDNCIFVEPRRIYLDLHGAEIGSNQRPLRAETAQGPRIALANSESVPAGTTIDITIRFATLGKGVDDGEVLREILDYGSLKGIGQWRNSGCGRFEWEILK